MLRVTLYETLANCDAMCLKLSVADAGGHPGAKEIKALHKGTFGAGGTTFTSATQCDAVRQSVVVPVLVQLFNICAGRGA